MGRTFIQRLLNALFNRKEEDNAICETKDQATTRDKTAKTANARSKADLKEKHKKGTQTRAAADKKLKLEIATRAASRVKNVVAETEAETEERIQSCAEEIKGCINMINNSNKGTPGKPKKSRKRAKVNDRKADKSADNRKASGSRKNDKSTKRSKQSVSPAEMVILLAKAEEKLSEAVVKAKEKDDKKK